MAGSGLSFADVLARAPETAQGRTVSVPETWHQGRTAYGGFSSALALTEAMRVGGDLPPLRSAQMAMMAPLHGEVEVRARVLRSGRNAIWVASEIYGDKGLGFTASFVFMRPVESTLALNDCTMPAGVLSPQQARSLAADRGALFLRHNFEVRFAQPRAQSPSEERRAEMCWWVRPHDVEALDPAVALLLTADALPPGLMRLLAPTAPVSTMHWQVNLLTPQPATVDGWWLLRSTSDYAKDGCSSQRMALWNAQGLPMLTGMQSIALFG